MEQRTYQKRTLDHLYRAVERVHLAEETPTTTAVVVYAERRDFLAERERLERWSADGGPTVLVGLPGHPPFWRQGNLHCFSVDDASPLAGERTLVVTDNITAAALVARRSELDASWIDVRDEYRCRMTFSPPYVADEFVRLAETLVDDISPALLARLLDAARTCRRLPLAHDDVALDPLLDACDVLVRNEQRRSAPA